MSTETLEAKELSLVSKVELRIAMAASDEKLQSILQTYLAPLLLKLASNFDSVRKKVISVCQHINTRIKLPTIQIPVAALLKQFKDHLNPLVRHFDLLYIQQGVSRLLVHERLDLLPILINGIKENYDESTASATTLFNLFLRLLHSMVFPQRGSFDDVALRDKLGLANQPQDASFIASWLGKVILFQPGSVRCAGLSVSEGAFLQHHGRKETWDPTAEGGMNLTETKVVLSKFLASGAFIDVERYLPALYMSADPNSKVSEVGEDLFKRAFSAISLDDPVLMRDLYKTYLGTAEDSGSLPARVSLKIKILSLLCRSKLAVSFDKENSRIIGEALNPETIQSSGSNQISNKGLEASKLRSQAFAFISWIARMRSQKDSLIAPELTSQLRGYIESQGWPRPRQDGSIILGELASRAIAYESIGLLAGSFPDQMLLDPDLDVLRWLFTSLSEDPCGNEVSLSIEQALSSILGALSDNLLPNMEVALTSLFSLHMSLQPRRGDESSGIIRSTRFMAIKFANRCLPFQSVKARWLNVLALCGDADERKEVIEEGRRGLDPYSFQILNPSKFGLQTKDGINRQDDLPEFALLTSSFFGAESQWDNSNFEKPHTASAYLSALGFCRNTLMQELLASHKDVPIVDIEWERRIDALISSDEEARFALHQNFRSLLNTHQIFQKALQIYLQACFNVLVSSESQDAYRAGEFIVELHPLIPTEEFAGVAQRIAKLEAPILSNHRSLRETSGRLFGLLASLEDSPSSVFALMIQIFKNKIMTWQQAVGSEALQIHGSVLAIAHYISRCKQQNEGLLISNDVRDFLVQNILNILSESRDKLLQEATLDAIAELASFGRMEGPFSINILGILKDLENKSAEGNEKAILALGHVLMQCHEDNSAESVLTIGINSLYKLHTIRRPEVQFSVGAALTCAASGLESKFLVSVVDVGKARPPLASRERTLDTVLDKILTDCKTSMPALRQAAVIWLLCLVQYCGHLKGVQDRLKVCQGAFKTFLADRDSLNQESASRGLTIIYEIGSRELKDELIRDLVGSFTGTTSNLMEGKVSEDTELFEEGALPTGNGSITTYKDIMSLASEIGDSSLVYQFMSLASNNAIWSSRAAFGRFGLSKLLSDVGADSIVVRNPKFYSALFRYRFDPNTNVRSSMNEIWTIVVKQPAATVNTHFEFIITDLLKNMLAKEWRTRQASCAALADLLQGRPQEMYQDHLNEIWTVTFKVCDDIKESVRTSAMSLARVLTNILIAGLQAGDSSAKLANSMLGQVLPFLLGPSGLESSAVDVQNFSRKTVIEIINKSSGTALRPFIPELVASLLALLTSIEPEMINYVHLNADKYGVSVEELDDARLKHIRGSKLLDSIERCLDFLDEDSMLQLQTYLENAIKTAIGLPSKFGCSRVLISLSTRQNFLFKPYADRMLLLGRKQALDKNETISSSYATSCGYIARLTSDETFFDHLRYCRRLYFDSDDDDRQRIISGDLVHALFKHATDRFNHFATEVLPFIFVAKHDVIGKAREFFKTAWDDGLGGRRAVSLYLAEIVGLISRFLDSARWPIKQASAYAIADVVMLSAASISDNDAHIIWPALEKALKAKTWDGKEKVLEALALFAKHSTLLSSDPTAADQMNKIVIREAQRNNAVYRPYALKCMGSLAELRESVDLYDQVLAIVSKVINELSRHEEDMDVDSLDDDTSSRIIRETTLVNATTALIKAIHPRVSGSEKLEQRMTQTFDLLTQANKSEFSSKSLKVATYENLQGLFGRIESQNDAMPAIHEQCLTKYAGMIFAAVNEVEQIRSKAADAAVAMARIFKKEQTTLRIGFTNGLEKMQAQERSISVREKLVCAGDILKKEV